MWKPKSQNGKIAMKTIFLKVHISTLLLDSFSEITLKELGWQNYSSYNLLVLSKYE